MSITHDRTAWLQGGDARCAQPPQTVRRVWRVVLLGAPGAGKGTQAELLHNVLGACALSTGEIFRAAYSHPCPCGSALAQAQAYMALGELVPDTVVMNLIRERNRCLHCRGGFMLDGFPRTLAQARALDELLTQEKLNLDAVIYYAVPMESLFARLAGRRVCPRCKAVYHLQTRPPRVEEVCDRCGTMIEQRPDDQPTAINVRLQTYTKATKPLLDYYREKGLLVTVRAEGEPADILARTLDAIVAREVPA